MKRLLFVDDEPMVLQGLRRMLRPMRHEWEMVFVESGEDALAALSTHHFDVIVSDMRMPQMDGVALLKEVAKRWPGVVRIALSGHAEMELILETVRAAHQYLAKPCDAGTLTTTIERACALRSLLADENLGRLVGQLTTLPSLPSLYVEVTRELAKPDSSMARVGQIIGQDVSMSAKMLQILNSAFFGLPRHVSSPAQAATLLGVNIVRSLVLSVKVFSAFDSRSGGLAIEALWSHSASVAALAKRIAITEGADRRTQDFAFVAGMLHDVGKLVLASELPERYREVVRLGEGECISHVDAEGEVFGCTHMEVGAYLLGLWGLANPVVEAVAFHHGPERSVGDLFTPLTAVHVAEAVDASNSDSELEECVDTAYLDRLGLSHRLPDWRSLRASANGERGVNHAA